MKLKAQHIYVLWFRYIIPESPLEKSSLPFSNLLTTAGPVIDSSTHSGQIHTYHSTNAASVTTIIIEVFSPWVTPLACTISSQSPHTPRDNICSYWPLLSELLRYTASKQAGTHYIMTTGQPSLQYRKYTYLLQYASAMFTAPFFVLFSGNLFRGGIRAELLCTTNMNYYLDAYGPPT